MLRANPPMANPNKICQHFSKLQIPKPTLLIHHSPPILQRFQILRKAPHPVPQHHRSSLLLLHNPNTNHGVRWVLAGWRVDTMWNRWVWWTSWGTACLGVIVRGVMIGPNGCPCFSKMDELDIRNECWPSCGCGLECENRLTQLGVSVRLKIVRDRRKGWVYTLFLVHSMKYVYQIFVWLLEKWTF